MQLAVQCKSPSIDLDSSFRKNFNGQGLHFFFNGKEGSRVTPFISPYLEAFYS